MHTHNLGVDFGGWSPDWPDGYGMLDELVNGNTIVPAGNTNISEENNPQVNALFTDAAKPGDHGRAADRDWPDRQADHEGRGDPARGLRQEPAVQGSDVTNVYVYAPFGMYNYAVLGVSR